MLRKITMFSSEKFDSTGFSNESSHESSKGSNFCGVERWEETEIDPFGLFNATEIRSAMSDENENHRQLQNCREFFSLDDLYLDVVSPPFQSCDDEIRKIFGIESQNSDLIDAEEKGSYVSPVASFELLRKYGNKRLSLPIENSNAGSKTQSSIMSTEKIIELAVEKFIQSLSQSEEIATISHPYPSSFLGHDSKEVELVQNLLLCAEKVGDKKYECSSKLLEEFDKISSSQGTPIQRLVHYFTEALYEKIDRETGTKTPKGLGKIVFSDPEALRCTSSFLIATHDKLPFSQITKFSGIQAVLDNVAEANKVHVIDLEIRLGVQYTILMQALTARYENPIQYLKITAVGTNSKTAIEETGKRLMSFAESLNLKLSFQVVMVKDILDLKTDYFELDPDEAVAVYAFYTLRNMIASADRLEHVMRVIKNLNPCVVVVTETEGSCNSPNFVRRFVEALFFYGVFFDSLAECLKNDEKTRKEAELRYFSSSIRNIVATEGGERKIRPVSINVWRAFFARFGLVEIELSMSSVYQANMMRQSFPCGSLCTLGMIGKCLAVGWKGTPLSTLSAWKFKQNLI
ncbi:hypothetical protein DH2020_020099 [Rehmannia glutinosa]|uniref:Uncharacterized protein n=1 Tax=Rehmannia glutinosa TaxID=99300 RepID=A0ABR0WJA1_REHGL